MISDSSHVQRSLQLARGRAEAVEDEVLADAVDPLAARRDLTGDEVSALALPGGEGADDLPGHVDDGDVVRPVAYDDLEGGQYLISQILISFIIAILSVRLPDIVWREVWRQSTSRFGLEKILVGRQGSEGRNRIAVRRCGKRSSIRMRARILSISPARWSRGMILA